MARKTHNTFTVGKGQRQGQPVWELVGSDGQPVADAERFIHTLVLRGLSPRTRRAYAYDLLEAHRWMAEADRQPERITGDDFIVITGVALHGGTGLNSVEVGSDRYSGQTFGAIVDTTGAFTCEIPLGVGENQLSVTARDNAGNETSKGIRVTVQLSALPKISIDTPADGSTVTEERITVSGLIRSSRFRSASARSSANLRASLPIRARATPATSAGGAMVACSG